MLRDLDKLKSEIESYRNEQKIWHTEREIKNSAGNLCLHLVGNLKHYIGFRLGQIPYQRQRDLEFSQKGIPRSTLQKMIGETREVVSNTLSSMSVSELDKEYPERVFKEKMSTGYFLIHLASHLGYHLGQVNYHRRLLDG